jgi:toxin ParE1/3/4
VDFVDEVQAALDAIADHPGRYAVASGDIREAPVNRFPYCVYYRVRAGRVVVVAIFHASRDPAVWQSRA